MKRDKYRSRATIAVDVMKAIIEQGEEQKLTHVLSRANIPYTRLTALLAELERVGMIESKANSERKQYIVTQKGVTYIKEYERFQRISRAFGLRI